MGWFSKKEKLIETPQEEMKCMCGYPFPPPARYVREGFSYKRIIVQYKKECPNCNKENIFNG